jgi:uncharacterized membrane protein HdeD (DUF308 family)
MDPVVMRAEGSIAHMLADRWWTLVVRGVAAILFGIVALVRPGAALLSIVLVFGIYAVVDGAFNLVAAVQRGRAGLQWGWTLFQGIVSVIAGVLAFVWPNITAVALLAIIAGWALVTGVAEIAAAIELRHLIKNEWMLIASGILSIALGVLLIVSPAIGALSVMWMIGGYAIVFGGLMIGLGIRLNGWRRSGKAMMPRGGAPTPA